MEFKIKLMVLRLRFKAVDGSTLIEEYVWDSIIYINFTMIIIIIPDRSTLDKIFQPAKGG
jgi:hypothetical protein